MANVTIGDLRKRLEEELKAVDGIHAGFARYWRWVTIELQVPLDNAMAYTDTIMREFYPKEREELTKDTVQ